jgi:hypothetical protein
MAEKPESRIVIPDKGLRIHVNTLMHSELLPIFAQAHAGTPMAGSQWYPNHPDLYDRETRNIHSVPELVSLMQTEDPKRLADAAVIFTTQLMPWKKYFIRPSRADGLERYSDLYNRVGKIKGGDMLPVAIVLQVPEAINVNERNHTIKGLSLVTDDHNNVDFELNLSYIASQHKSDLPIPKGKFILAAGMAERSYAARSVEKVRIQIDQEESLHFFDRMKDLTTPPPPRAPVPPMTLTREDLGRHLD